MRLLIAVAYMFFAIQSFAEEYVSPPVVDTPSVDKYYTGFLVGYSHTFSPNKKRFEDHTSEDSAQAGLVLGRYFENDVRVEFEGSYKTKTISKSPSSTTTKEQSFESLLCLMNIYKSWNYRSDNTIKPFIMVGVGMSQNKAGDFNAFDSTGDQTSTLVGKKTKNFAYQLGAGVSLKINQNSYLDFSARYAYRGAANTTNRRISTSSGAETTQNPEKAIMKDALALVTIRLNL